MSSSLFDADWQVVASGGWRRPSEHIVTLEGRVSFGIEARVAKHLESQSADSSVGRFCVMLLGVFEISQHQERSKERSLQMFTDHSGSRVCLCL